MDSRGVAWMIKLNQNSSHPWTNGTWLGLMGRILGLKGRRLGRKDGNNPWTKRIQTWANRGGGLGFRV